MSKCCDSSAISHEHKHKLRKLDPILHGCSLIIFLAMIIFFVGVDWPWARPFAQAVVDLLKTMWWGMALGLVLVGLMSQIPKTYFNAILGRGDTLGGILRATAAGVLLDLCSHGILMVGAKLYERGASLAQLMAFLIASPWNSLSLTVILISLIGLQWTLVFITCSVLIAVLTGIIFMELVKRGVLPENPHKIDTPQNFDLIADARERLKNFKPNLGFFKDVLRLGWLEGKMLVRWLLLGIVIAAAIRAFVPTEIFSHYFGPSMLGLFMTLIAATVIEVCSEGSTPIAADIVNRAGAVGNGFTFLMAGVSTDYTEVMILREVTKSWKTALFLPLITLPQILILGYILNMFPM